LAVDGKIPELAAEPSDMPLDVLRLTDTNRGGSMGVCGVCTVMIDDKMASSCMVLAGQANGCNITAIERVANAKV